MRKSKNFELNLYEGSDLFNPLTNDVPNYEKIDEQMEKNYNASVGKATELRTGTVHALTRVNTNCPMIHFTATSNFTSGDTFTVDGVQVSALLVDGSTLPTNCYIIGSEVLCYLKGTLLTFYIAGSIAKDSEKLGGELPSYYAIKTEFDALSQVVESSSDLIRKNSDSINSNTQKINSLLNYEDISAKIIFRNVESNSRWRGAIIPISETLGLCVINATIVPSSTTITYTVPQAVYGVDLGMVLIGLGGINNVSAQLGINGQPKQYYNGSRNNVVAGGIYVLNTTYIVAI